MNLPRHASVFERKWPAFSRWLIDHGSAVIGATNRYEVARFLTDQGIGIVYKNNTGRITHWANGADRAMAAFLSGQEWRAVEKRIKKRTAAARQYAALADRDGAACIYCGRPLDAGTATIEHVFPIASGGTDHLANLALACEQCNAAAGSLPPAQKIALAILQRTKGESR